MSRSHRRFPSRRPTGAALALVLALAPLACPTTALAEDAPVPPADIPMVEAPAPLGGARAIEAIDPASGLPIDPALPDVVAPYAAPDGGLPLGLGTAPAVARTGLLLTAKLSEDGRPLGAGVVWRVFGDKVGPDGRLPLVASGTGGDASFEVDPGVYLVYCGFGHAGTTVRVEVRGGLTEEAVVLNAGGLKLSASASEDRPLPAEDVRFDVYSLETDDRGERKVVAHDVKAGELLRLTGDTYHVVSRYGRINAMTRADVEVKSGKLTEVTLYQRAAEVTLKLVGESGGEAIADTKWSVLTPGGDIVTEGVGAFPSFILAAGEYTVVAKHGEQVYARNFGVETGVNAEVEVIARQ